MSKLIRNRVFIVFICGILAFGCILSYANSVRTEAQKVQVIRVKAPIEKGDKITKDMLETVTVGGFNMPKDITKTVDQVVNKYAAADFTTGDYILAGKLSDQELSANDRLSQLDGSRLAFSISIKDFSDGVSDKLRSGDIVSAVVSEKGKVDIPKELTYMEVLTTTTAKGVDTDSKNKSDNQDNLKTVTLLATPAQILQLTNYEDNAEIHLALVFRGDHETAKKFLDKQNGVLSNG
jgi:pilus assembly protein CpaB